MTSTGSWRVARTRPPLIAVVSTECLPFSADDWGRGEGGWYEGRLVDCGVESVSLSLVVCRRNGVD